MPTIAEVFGSSDGQLQDNVLEGDLNNTRYIIYGDVSLTLFGAGVGGDDVISITGTGNTFPYHALFGDGYILSDTAQGGDDTITGGSDCEGNYLYGDGYELRNSAMGGNDTLIGGNNVNTNRLFGDGINLFDNAVGGNDTLTGGNNGRSNDLYGDGYHLYGNAVGGDDIITGGDNAEVNFLFGDGVNLRENAAGGNDVLVAGNGGFTDMFGDGGNAYGTAQGGDDILISGTGRDFMVGDFRYIRSSGVTTGSDTFVIVQNSGQDIIADFERGQDTIDLSSLSVIDLPIPAAALDRLPAAAREAILAQHSSFGFGTLDSNGNGELDAGDDYVEITSGNTVVDLGAAQGSAAGVDVLSVWGVTGLMADDFTF